MTTNNNLKYYVDFYPASDAEESDSDPTFHAEGMSLGTIYDDLAQHVGKLAVVATYIEGAGTGETMHSIASLAAPDVSLGVVYVRTEEV